MMTKSQIHRMVAAGRCIEAFTHSVFGTYDVTAARRMIFARPQRFGPHTCRFEDLQARGKQTTGADVVAWLIGQREVDPARCLELTDEQLRDPVINMETPDGSAYIVDGIHRLARRLELGKKFFRYWLVPASMMPRPEPGWVDVPWGNKVVTPEGLKNRGEE